MSKARVLAKLGWRAYVIKVEMGQDVNSLDAVVREIWGEFIKPCPCEDLANALLEGLGEWYSDCLIRVKILAVGWDESAFVDNGYRVML